MMAQQVREFATQTVRTWAQISSTHKKTLVAGEMTKWLRPLAALEGDLGSVPSTHSRRLTTTYNSSSWGSSALFWPLGTSTQVVCIHTLKAQTHRNF